LRLASPVAARIDSTVVNTPFPLRRRINLRSRIRVLLGAAAVAAVGAAVFTGVGTAGAAHTAQAPTVTILYGTAPDYLDPQHTYSTQGEEALWVANLGLYTYAHKN